MEKCDLFVIGGGSGGVRAARRAAESGAKVVLAEQSELGGTCVNIGCVPKKLFYYAASYASEWRQAGAYGWRESTLGDMAWQHLLANKNAEIKRLNKVYADLLTTANVRVVNAAATLKDANTVQAGATVFRAEHILIATGGAPSRPPIDGGDLAVVSNDLFYLPALPRRIVLIGAGYIALEFAGIFAGLGAETTLCYRADLPMRGLDDDIRRQLAEGIAANGVCLRAGQAPTKIEQTADGKRLTLENGDTVDADLVVLATGRRPATDTLGLAAAGVEQRANGTIPVNDSYQSVCPSVYAIGDVLQTPALTPVATAEAEVFVRRVFKGDSQAAVDYDAVPTAVFCRPSLATAGISETTAQKRGLKIAVWAAAFRPMKSGFAGMPDKTHIKLITDAGNNRVLGAQMLGEHAAECMQGIAVAIKAGATKSDFDNTVGIHPTSVEEFVTLRERIR